MRLLADENFKEPITQGILRRDPTLDIVRVQQVGLIGADDPVVLEWAAQNERVLLTHDAKTVPAFAYKRVVNELFMPGVLLVPWATPIGQAVEDTLTAVQAALRPDEYNGRVIYLPL